MTIRIVKRPHGEAPENIRDAWIGLVLPVKGARLVEGRGFGVLSVPRTWLGRRLKKWFGQVPRLQGYLVETAAAVDLLKRANPSAASWWTANTPHLFESPELCLLFEKECCIVESPGGAPRGTTF
jgi:hypothetical protein